MRLTSYSNYTMRVLMVAAARSPALSTIREVAHSFNISEAHLVKCVHQLGTWGYLATVRGNTAPLHRLLRRIVVAGVRGANVKRHHNVAAQRVLNIHAHLRRNKPPASVQMALKGDALFFDFADAAERKNLKPAAIR